MVNYEYDIFNYQKDQKKDFKYYLGGIITIVFTTIYIGYGIYSAYNVKETSYTFSSDKLDNKYRIALVSDSHLGTTFDADGFNRQKRL